MTKKTEESSYQTKLALLAAVAAVPLMLASTPGMAGPGQELSDVPFPSLQGELITGGDTKLGKGASGTISLNFAQIPIEYKELLMLACCSGQHIKSCVTLRTAVNDYLGKGGKEPSTAVDYFLKIEGKDKETSAKTVDHYLKTISGGKEPSSAAVDYFLKLDGIKGEKWVGPIAGADDKGNTIYKNQRGEYFYLDAATGDKKFLSADIFLKIELARKTSIVGLDPKGNVMRQNDKGEMFYLEPNTGDMITVDDRGSGFIKQLANPDPSGKAIIDAENAVMQLKVNINQLALSIFDRWGNLKAENPQSGGGLANIADQANGGNMMLQGAKDAFAAGEYNKASDLAKSSQEAAKAAGIQLESWSFGASQPGFFGQPVVFTATTPVKKTPAPTDEKTERVERPDFNRPEVIDKPELPEKFEP